jgi:hypothetical protein
MTVNIARKIKTKAGRLLGKSAVLVSCFYQKALSAKGKSQLLAAQIRSPVLDVRLAAEYKF